MLFTQNEILHILKLHLELFKALGLELQPFGPPGLDLEPSAPPGLDKDSIINPYTSNVSAFALPWPLL